MAKFSLKKTFRLDAFVTAFFVHHQNFDSVFKFYNSTTYVHRRFASRIKRRSWVDQTARKLVEVTEREARRRHRHGNINVKITFAVGANIDHPCCRGHKGGRLPNRKLIQALARLRRVVLIDEYYTTKRYVYISRCISVLIIQHHSSNQVLLL